MCHGDARGAANSSHRPRDLNALYVTIADPLDASGWSGINRHMALALQRQGLKTQFAGPLGDPYSSLKRVRSRVNRVLGRRRYLPDRSHLSAKAYARQVRGRMSEGLDLVFSTGIIPLAYLDTQLPTVFWADATMPAMVD